MLLCTTVAMAAAGAVQAAAPALPPSDSGVGLYWDISTWKGEATMPEVLADMKAHGCNTACLFFRNAEELAAQLDAGVECGLWAPGVPVVLCSNCAGDNANTAAELRRAPSVGQHTAQWPTLTLYVLNEVEEASPELEALIEEWKSYGVGAVGGCAYERAAWQLSDQVDVLQVFPVFYTQALRERYAATGKALWAYEGAGPVHVGRNPAACRYLTGVWRWKFRPPVYLEWCYADAVGNPTMWEAWKQGCLDYWVLRNLDAQLAAHPTATVALDAARWQQELLDRIAGNPGRDAVRRPPDYTDALAVHEVPPPVADFAMIRQWAGYYAAALRGGENLW